MKTESWNEVLKFGLQGAPVAEPVILMRNSTNTTEFGGRGLTAGPEGPQTRGTVANDFSTVFTLPAGLTLIPVAVFVLLCCSRLLQSCFGKMCSKSENREVQVVVQEPPEETINEEKADWSEVRLFVFILTGKVQFIFTLFHSDFTNWNQ